MGVSSSTPLLGAPSKFKAVVTALRFSRAVCAHVLQGKARRHNPLPGSTPQRKVTPRRRWQGKRRPRTRMRRTRWSKMRMRRRMKKTTTSCRKATTRSRRREKIACGKEAAQAKCEKTCRKTASCYGFKASSGVGRSRRRCTFYESGGGDGEACLARCKMPAGKACDGYAEVFSGASCAPGCAVGLTVSVDTPAPKSLSCKDGALTPTPDYTCVDAAAKGKLTVTVVKASNLEDEDWMS